MKRLLIALCCICLLFVCSCGEKAQPEQPSGSKSETDSTPVTDADPFLAGPDYRGAQVRVHVRGDQESVDELGTESNGELLSEALWSRTEATQKRLNVQIVPVIGEPYSSYNKSLNEIRMSVNVGFGAYDLIAGWSTRIVTLMTEGLYLNLDEQQYYSSDDPWWSRSVTNALTIGGKIYMNTGDIAATYMDSCYAVIINQAVSEKFGYRYDDFYEIVNSGDWTMEYFSQLVRDSYSDDGDGVRNDKDLYGLVCSYLAADAFWSSCDISIIENNGTDHPTLNFNTARIQRAAESVHSLFYGNIGAEVGQNGSTIFTSAEDLSAAFMQDRAMFTIVVLKDLKDFSAMKTVYGVLPVPKLDHDQDEYRTNVQQSMSLWGIPKDAKDPTMSAAVLTSLGSDSRDIVIEPHYYKLLRTRYVKDSTSGYMIDLIYNGIYMNFDTLFNEALGESVSASDRPSMPAFIFRCMGRDTTPNMEGWWSTYSEGLQKRLLDICSALM